MVIFAIQRIINGEIHVNHEIMMITALIGIGFNLFMASFLTFSKLVPNLMSHGHSHSHHQHRF